MKKYFWYLYTHEVYVSSRQNMYNELIEGELLVMDSGGYELYIDGDDDYILCSDDDMEFNGFEELPELVREYIAVMNIK